MSSRAHSPDYDEENSRRQRGKRSRGVSPSSSYRGSSPPRRGVSPTQNNRRGVSPPQNNRRGVSPPQNNHRGVSPTQNKSRVVSPTRSESFEFHDDINEDDFKKHNRQHELNNRKKIDTHNKQKNIIRNNDDTRGGKPSRGPLQSLDSIRDPEKRYLFQEVIGRGICGTVHLAIDTEADNKKVAVKVQSLTPDNQPIIVEEYKVYRDFGGHHPNLPEFYGIYRKRTLKKGEYDEIWFVLEFFDGGTVMDLVRSLAKTEKKLREEHIAYILKETIKGLIFLHENNIIHRDVRGNNIMLTKQGQVKILDFGLSKMTKGHMGKRQTSIGSPCWMAPEVVTSIGNKHDGYTARSDVWSVGITAIEMADVKAPFQDIHPTRTLFQIVRNPPPNLHRPINWSENFNDFISECLEKNPDNRPAMQEIIEHPFLSELPENDYQTDRSLPGEVMLSEDLAGLEVLTEDTILDELHDRLRRGEFQTFIGDILVILNPNEIQDIYGFEYHEKYNYKCRSENAPHIYSVADRAYQDVLHNQEPQSILFAGETNSGKTTNVLHLIRHLMYIGKSMKDIGVRVMRAIDLIHSFTQASTPLNSNSTRCVLQTQITFGSTGKASGAIFWLYQLEKWRVSTYDKNQSNFHIFYYLYDGLEARGKLNDYSLPPGRRLRYLRIADKASGNKRSFKIRNDPQGNSLKYDEINDSLKLMEMDEHLEFIWKTLAGILLLGEIKFTEDTNGGAEIQNNDIANTVASHLGVDKKKFLWCLTNYCLIKNGSAVRRKQTCNEAKESRNVLANTLYQRLVDWIINNINMKISMTRTLFGDKFVINVMDLFGFECFSVNRLEQLIVNTMNEQLQCYYNQKIFAWETQELEEEDIRGHTLHYYDNREAINQLIGKNHSLFQMLDLASKEFENDDYLLEKIKQRAKTVHIKSTGHHEFTIAHYTGKIMYDSSDMIEKNRDFVPPEMTNTMRQSIDENIKQIFTNQLTKAGNLTISNNDLNVLQKKTVTKIRRGPMLVTQELPKLRSYNTPSKGQFSQTRKMRTCASTFRSTSLEILKNLSAGSGGTHFVRCIRADLDRSPRGFYREVVRQQIRALALLDTSKARQQGYSHRISFQEFLRRYKCLAFDYEENVDTTKDNCRLLLIRLKMEGWMIGKTKVFLKYYNEEYLSRLYETHVRKIIKIQSMLRAVLARKKADKEAKKKKITVKKNTNLNNQNKASREMSEDQAAVKIQSTFRGRKVRKEIHGEFDEETRQFISHYGYKWKSKSIFQVLLNYRSARYHDLVQFSQQVHLFNQALVGNLHQQQEQHVNFNDINPRIKRSDFADKMPRTVYKLPFDLASEFNSTKTTYINEMSKGRRRPGSNNSSGSDEDIEPWDTPLHRKPEFGNNRNKNRRDIGIQTSNSPHRSSKAPLNRGESIIYTPFTRDPNVPIQLPPDNSSQKGQINSSTNRVLLPSVNSHIPRSNINHGRNDSIRSRKKMPPPPVPMNQNRNQYNEDDNWQYDDRSKQNATNINRVNPINELKTMARESNAVYDNTDDEPPFNFQAMLRKTPHHRDSMKRTPIYESYDNKPTGPRSFVQSSSTNHRNHEISSRPRGDPVPIANKRASSQQESPEWSPNEMVRMSEKYGRQDDDDKEHDNVNGFDDNKTTLLASDGLSLVELAPGVTVKGYIADL
ncbi:hypothetical protein HCN44_005732 [Aphidius gifuensis]|uniref:non-specific serine/threonine protein kinase n=1 Tax=Aphidius gifuensis TaxID=684658 RepID=A0A834XUE9_APHGI|nr:hypothetical protein HCN44_005732 [Aphidius gifuensis]